MDLAVVSSAWGTYGRFLPEWAQSITAQTVPPSQVVILDAGCTDTASVSTARDLLTTAGLKTTVVTARCRGMGAARNTAVAATRTAWVMHLDADDLLLPHALEDVAALTPDADVVSLGALLGDQARCFPGITREQILDRNHGCYSCSPFRRTFWERRPWHTRNDWIDSTFWVGFAHLGARFTGTERPGFVYRQHPESFSHRLSPWEKRLATRQWLRACRRWSLT